MTSTATTYRGHTGWVRCLAWSPDGHHIASGGADNTVQVWEALTGARMTTYHGHDSGVLGVVWSPTQPLIASVAWDGDGAHVWEVDTSRRVNWRREAVTLENALAWSPSGRFLALRGYRVAHV